MSRNRASQLDWLTRVPKRQQQKRQKWDSKQNEVCFPTNRNAGHQIDTRDNIPGEVEMSDAQHNFASNSNCGTFVSPNRDFKWSFSSVGNKKEIITSVFFTESWTYLLLNSSTQDGTPKHHTDYTDYVRPFSSIYHQSILFYWLLSCQYECLLCELF